MSELKGGIGQPSQDDIDKCKNIKGVEKQRRNEMKADRVVLDTSQVKVLVEMSYEEALWLRSFCFNSLVGESEKDTEIRKRLFQVLQTMATSSY